MKKIGSPQTLKHSKAQTACLFHECTLQLGNLFVANVNTLIHDNMQIFPLSREPILRCPQLIRRHMGIWFFNYILPEMLRSIPEYQLCSMSDFACQSHNH